MTTVRKIEMTDIKHDHGWGYLVHMDEDHCLCVDYYEEDPEGKQVVRYTLTVAFRDQAMALAEAIVHYGKGLTEE